MMGAVKYDKEDWDVKLHQHINFVDSMRFESEIARVSKVPFPNGLSDKKYNFG
ncbi:hypothetical protein GCM10028803_50610 [Larkinella knui]